MSNVVEANKILVEDRRSRVSAAAQIIETALRDNNCDLIAKLAITDDGRITYTIQIVPK